MSNDENKPTTLSGLVQKASDGDTHSENALAQLFLNQALNVLPQRAAGGLAHEDHEDIAISAVKSFCIGIRSGRYQYQGDKQLYALLHKIIDGKIRKLWQYHFADKRDIKRSESLEQNAAFNSAGVDRNQKDSLRNAKLPQVAPEQINVAPEEQPAVDRILEDLQLELRGLFSVLLNELDPHPRRLLLAMLEQDSDNVQLAKTIGRSVASVERYRKQIREKVEILGSQFFE